MDAYFNELSIAPLPTTQAQGNNQPQTQNESMTDKPEIKTQPETNIKFDDPNSKKVPSTQSTTGLTKTATQTTQTTQKSASGQSTTGLTKTATQNQKVSQNNEGNSKSGDQGQQNRRIYSHHSFAEFCATPAPIKYYIKGYIQEQALEMFIGEPASGKSFIAVDIAASIACPEIHSWHGRTIKHGPVIYMAGEGIAGLRKRFAGWAAKRRINPANVQLEVIDETFQLDDITEDYNISNTIENIKAIFPNPALIIIDTLNVFMAGDENRAQDVAAILSACRKLIRELGCTVLLVHHTGLSNEAKNRARGSSALRGAMDIELQARKEKSSNFITITQNKNKEAQEEKDLVLTLEQFEIPDWYDEEGQPVNTCTVEAYNSEIHGDIKAKEKIKLCPSERTAQASFIEAVLRYGEKISDKKIGHKLVCVELENWRLVSYELSTKDTARNKRNEFNQGRNGLCEKGILIKREYGGHDYYCVNIGMEADNPAGNEFKMAVGAKITIHDREQKEREQAQTGEGKNAQ